MTLAGVWAKITGVKPSREAGYFGRRTALSTNENQALGERIGGSKAERYGR